MAIMSTFDNVTEFLPKTDAVIDTDSFSKLLRYTDINTQLRMHNLSIIYSSTWD